MEESELELQVHKLLSVCCKRQFSMGSPPSIIQRQREQRLPQEKNKLQLHCWFLSQLKGKDK